MDEPLVVIDYEPGWPAAFERLRQRVAWALGDLACVIEHVGGTAVPGLAAKPVIDLDVAVPAAVDIPTALRRLEAIGYRPGARTLDVPADLVAPGWPEGEERHHP